MIGHYNLPPAKGRIGNEKRGYQCHCSRCGSITEFPSTMIGSNASSVDRMKRIGFRIIKRKSWEKQTTYGACGGRLKKPRTITEREELGSCMTCNHHRGTDCDEHWTEDRCTHSWIQITPFTICDLFGKEVKWDREKGYVVTGDYYGYGWTQKMKWTDRYEVPSR